MQSYASILYLRLPHFFRMILRGKEVEHHNIVNDMMHKQEVTYRPQYADGHSKDPNVMPSSIPASASLSSPLYFKLYISDFFSTHLFHFIDGCCCDNWFCKGCKTSH